MASNLSQIILQGGRQQAEAHLRRGEIEARRQEQSGETWGRAFASIGDIVSGIPSRREQQQRAATVDRSNQLKLSEQEREAASQQRYSQLIAATQGQGLEAIANALIESGEFAEKGHDILDRAVKVRTQTLQLETAEAAKHEREMKRFGDLLQGMNDDTGVARVRSMLPSVISNEQARLGVQKQLEGSFDPQKRDALLSTVLTQEDLFKREQQQKELRTRDLANTKTYQEMRDAEMKRTAEVILTANPNIASVAVLDFEKAYPEMAGRLDPSGTPESVMKARSLVLGPKEMADNAAQAAGQTETARHNRAMEETARISANKPPAASTVVLQTADGPQLVDKRTGTTKPITDVSGAQVAQAPTADMRNKTVARGLVAKSIGAVKTLGDGIMTKVGPAQRADALKRGAEAVLGHDPAFRTYQDARMALAGNLAVGQQGSRPSDADIRAIWLPLVPDPFRDTKESAAMKWSLIETMSNTAPDAPSVPDAVKGALSSVGPGSYELSDGHMYRKGLDGSITQVK